MDDIDALLAPVSADSPCGEDLSFSPELDAIQEARRSDDASLDQGEWVTQLKTSDWPAVIEQCSALLRTRSKDIRLAIWLAEAYTYTHGFAGVAAGYRLVARLCDQYWDGLHPILEGEDDAGLRVGNLGWLLAQSGDWIRAIPLTNAPDGRYTTIDLEVAIRKQPAAGGGERPDLAAIESARTATSFDFYQDLAASVPLAREALQYLEHVVDDKLGLDGPSFTATRELLENAGVHALRMAAAAGIGNDNGKNAPSPEPVAKSTPVDAAEAPPAPAIAASSGEITSRREALAQLQQIAQFFRRTEPHSPVAYLAERAAKWGQMPLHVWLQSVLKDDTELAKIQELLDVNLTASSGDDGT